MSRLGKASARLGDLNTTFPHGIVSTTIPSNLHVKHVHTTSRACLWRAEWVKKSFVRKFDVFELSAVFSFSGT